MLHCAKMRRDRARRYFIAVDLAPLKRPVYRGGRHCWRAAAALSLLHVHRPLAGPIPPGHTGLPMSLNHVTLDDKYDLTKSRVFVTGYQALVRLTMMQHERDKRAGLNTAGYVTGYRGSPLGSLDQQFIRAQRALDKYDIRFQAGLNEDI